MKIKTTSFFSIARRSKNRFFSQNDSEASGPEVELACARNLRLQQTSNLYLNQLNKTKYR